MRYAAVTRQGWAGKDLWKPAGLEQGLTAPMHEMQPKKRIHSFQMFLWLATVHAQSTQSLALSI